MTTFLQRTGKDLAIASVIAPLTSYGLHRMIPAPDVHFIAVASTLNICVATALRDLINQYITQANEKDVDKKNSNTFVALTHLSHILQTSTAYLLPIFTKSICQRIGIQAPDYLPLIGYISIINATFWITKHCVAIYDACYPKTATK